MRRAEGAVLEPMLEQHVERLTHLTARSNAEVGHHRRAIEIGFDRIKVLEVGAFWMKLYNYAWFVGFGVAAVVHVALTRALSRKIVPDAAVRR